MAWEWLAPTAAVAGAFVGGSTTWLVGLGTRKHAETIADKNHAHTERMALDAREHKRLEEAYIEMLQLVGQVHYWATRVYPLMDTDPPQPVPDGGPRPRRRR